MSSRPARPKVVQPRPTNKDATATLQADGIRAPQAAAASPLRPTRPAIQNASGASSSDAASTAGPSSRPAGPKIVSGAGSGSTILVNNCQRRNPVLKDIKSVGWELAAIPADYQVGVSTGCLFLSLRYHQLHPEYIHTRINKISGMYSLRLLLVQSDIPDPQSALKELTKVALVNSLTLLVAWSPEESARYLESFKIFEHKPPDLIRERRKDDWLGAMTGCLTSVKGVNKTDAVGLLSRFGSLKKLSKATASDLSLVPGLGEIKVKRLREALTTPFRVGERRSFRERKAARMSNDDSSAGALRPGLPEADEIEDDIENSDTEVHDSAKQREPAGVAASSSGAGNLAQILQRGSAAEDVTSEAAVVQEAPPTADASSGPSTSASRHKPSVVDDDEFQLDDDDLAALDAIEELPTSSARNATSGTTDKSRPRHNLSANDSAEDDGLMVEGDLADLGDELEGLDELNAEEREELRKAMKMSLA
ncbi:unnamed protein product [Parajaminaea phylloscopi]